MKFNKMLLQTILTVLKIIILSKRVKRSNRTFESKRCLVLGNGPSLKSVFSDKELLNEGMVKLCVNYFALSPEFEKSKPELMVLQAPEFWIDDVNESYKINRKELFEAIISKTDWELELYVPAKFRGAKDFNGLMKSNSHIHIHYFNDTPIEGYAWFKHFCFNNSFGIPRPHNVVIPSLMVAIKCNFKEINLVGVDHSWLDELSVNENNEALVGQQHFYDEKEVKPDVMYKLGKKPRRLHEILEKFMLTFKGYFEIRDYADSKGVKIYNLTKGSFIDAFERKT